ncbi:MAG: hypothetical protein MUF33_01350 [Candidatus Nanopelagicales bacterium]|jgi:hypothetical protein|nr:hypothetical protein [Candidatus Nanopelagicales bacterium]MCU0294645.1 hypothetical protein [Candidatus Nanopelagicales bacterium]MCU0297146.1 hypothetical protein [Candidatus Nanopelagicales bacterium]
MVQVATRQDAPVTSRWVGFHVVFALVAVVVLLVPLADTGVRVLALVVGYNIALPIVARRTGDDDLWVTWAALAPMSVLMVLPDWFLSAVLGSIQFPNTGSPYIGTMPIFMAGMWTIALLPIMMIGRQVEAARSVVSGFVAVSVCGLLLFVAAEWFAPSIPLWEPLDVAQVAGVAVYVLLPELALCIATYALVRGVRNRPKIATIGGIVAIPFMYLGMLATSYQFLG